MVVIIILNESMNESMNGNQSENQSGMDPSERPGQTLSLPEFALVMLVALAAQAHIAAMKLGVGDAVFFVAGRPKDFVKFAGLARTRGDAVRKAQVKLGLPADSYPSAELLDRLRAFSLRQLELDEQLTWLRILSLCEAAGWSRSSFHSVSVVPM